MQNDLNFEDALLKKAQTGDLHSFEALILRYEKLIYNVAFKLTQNAEDAKDCAQESLIKIHKNLDKCVSISHFKAWVCTITNNTVMDEFRKKKNRKTISTDDDVNFKDGFKDILLRDQESGSLVEDEILRKELSEELVKAMNTLPHGQKVLIVLRDIQGYSYNEISEILGISLGTVKSRISRARNNLKIAILKARK